MSNIFKQTEYGKVVRKSVSKSYLKVFLIVKFPGKHKDLTLLFITWNANIFLCLCRKAYIYKVCQASSINDIYSLKYSLLVDFIDAIRRISYMQRIQHKCIR